MSEPIYKEPTNAEECDELLTKLEEGIESLRPFVEGEHGEIPQDQLIVILRGYIRALELFMYYIIEKNKFLYPQD